MTDEAQAVAEVAKTTGDIVKAAGGFGAYLARVFGSIPENALGLIGGDWLEHKRRRHLAVLEVNTARILEGIAEDRLTEPSPSVLIPLLQAAVDEGRPELQTKWSALLANAMVDGGRKVRRDYFEVVRQMEPQDARILDIVRRRPNAHTREPVGVTADHQFFEHERTRAAVQPDEWEVSVSKLVQLGLAQWEAFPVLARLTAFGRGFLNACTAP